MRKIADVVENMGQTVTRGYKAIETGAVSGMSLIMTDFGAVLGKAAFPVGIVAGVIGLVLVALAYPVYNRELKKQREKAAPEILRLTDALMK